MKQIIISLLLSCSGCEADSDRWTDSSELVWNVMVPTLLPGEKQTFDEVAVKDPSIVHHDGKWHLFYTARSRSGYSIGYVAARSLGQLQLAKRHRLHQLRGTKDPYAAAPQVFFFKPRNTWYLIYQTRDSNYQPVFSTTATIDIPTSWSKPNKLVAKDDAAKWIDFWIICDDESAYLFFTRSHRDVCVMTTSIADFPRGFRDVRKVFSPVHEAVHIYRVASLGEYHMFYELRASNRGLRQYGLAVAESLAGPWRKITDDLAAGEQLRYADGVTKWTGEVSHGEVIRAGYNQLLEYDPARTWFLIQGLLSGEHVGPYTGLRWKLGLIEADGPLKYRSKEN